ncbi:MAG: hypothetical protein ACRDAX_10075 [Propionibacteriaceae bacterium]
MKRFNSTSKASSLLVALLITTAIMCVAGVVLIVQGWLRFKTNESDNSKTIPTLYTTSTKDTLRSIASAELITSGRKYPVSTTGAVTRDGISQGSSITSGDIIAVINERPIFFFESDVPNYRPLSPGTTGRDVAGLHNALEKLGYAIYPKEKAQQTIGISTSSALANHYRKNDFAPLAGDGTPLPTNGNVATVGLPAAEFITAPTATIKAITDCGKVGETVGSPLCTLMGAPWQSQLSVNKSNSEQIKPGMSVLKGKDIIGTVGEKNTPVAEKSSTENQQPNTEDYFALSISPTATLSQAPKDNVEVLIAEAIDAIVVESSAIRGTPTDPWIETADNQRHNIQVGLCVAGRCAITGIEPDTKIILPTPR